MPTTNKKFSTFCAYGAAAVAALQVALFLVSWLITAASPETTVRSLLSNEGIRWFFGTFTDNVVAVPLAWIIVAAMAYGALRQSGMLRAIANPRPRTYRQTFALRIVTAELLLFVVVIIVVAFIPHAALLSVTGELFPSSFSSSLVPIIAFCVAMTAITYGLLTATMRSLAEVFLSLCRGLASATPLIVLHVFIAEFYFSLRYVFPL
ncbi:MAG: AbgT family transporter [Prevotella sp.]|nr:AbgT family transporter [Prevotella sp.]